MDPLVSAKFALDRIQFLTIEIQEPVIRWFSSAGFVLMWADPSTKTVNNTGKVVDDERSYAFPTK